MSAPPPLRSTRMRASKRQTHYQMQCPICKRMFTKEAIQEHADLCASRNYTDAPTPSRAPPKRRRQGSADDSQVTQKRKTRKRQEPLLLDGQPPQQVINGLAFYAKVANRKINKCIAQADKVAMQAFIAAKDRLAAKAARQHARKKRSRAATEPKSTMPKSPPPAKKRPATEPTKATSAASTKSKSASAKASSLEPAEGHQGTKTANKRPAASHPHRRPTLKKHPKSSPRKAQTVDDNKQSMPNLKFKVPKAAAAAALARDDAVAKLVQAAAAVAKSPRDELSVLAAAAVKKKKAVTQTNGNAAPSSSFSKAAASSSASSSSSPASSAAPAAPAAPASSAQTKTGAAGGAKPKPNNNPKAASASSKVSTSTTKPVTGPDMSWLPPEVLDFSKFAPQKRQRVRVSPSHTHATDYIQDLSVKYTNSPKLLQRFFYILREFSRNQMGVQAVMNQVANLFGDRLDFMIRFNRFLPVGYWMEDLPQFKRVFEAQMEKRKKMPKQSRQLPFDKDMMVARQFVKKVQEIFHDKPQMFQEFLHVVTSADAGFDGCRENTQAIEQAIIEVRTKVSELFAANERSSMMSEFMRFLPPIDLTGDCKIKAK